MLQGSFGAKVPALKSSSERMPGSTETCFLDRRSGCNVSGPVARMPTRLQTLKPAAHSQLLPAPPKRTHLRGTFAEPNG